MGSSVVEHVRHVVSGKANVGEKIFARWLFRHAARRSHLCPHIPEQFHKHNECKWSVLSTAWLKIKLYKFDAARYSHKSKQEQPG